MASAASHSLPGDFPPIEDLGLIGDCRSCALISRSGTVEWLCFPDFHDQSLFCSLLDRNKGGYFRVAPTGAASTSRRYVGATGILETTFETPKGRARVIDFMPIPIREDRALQPERELIRIVEGEIGEVEIEVVYAPRPGYGQEVVSLNKRGNLGWAIAEPGTLYLLRTDIDLEAAGKDVLRGRVRVRAGDRYTLSLSFCRRDTAVIPGVGREADEKLRQTRSWWERWSEGFTYEGPYRDPVLRSLLVLKHLQFSLSGAVMAAATTSLPEAIGQIRNWDYRYCWPRDAAFTLQAFIAAGFYSEARAFFDWLMHATWMTQPRLQSLYDAYGRPEVDEYEISQLDGYKHSKPVRVGNAAHQQLQLDIYGSVVEAAALFVRAGNPLDRTESRLLVGIGEAVCKLWREPDNGIWEFREGRRHNTWSKVMCWSALNDLLQLDEDNDISVPRERFLSERDTIRNAVFEHAYNEELGTFVGAFGDTFLDATLLLLPRTGFIAPNDRRMENTWVAIEEQLQRGHLIDRYSRGADKLAGQEGAFVICSFWAVDYLARCGRLDEAKERMTKLVDYANDLGLLSEEINVEDGSLLGNFPQAFSHTGLVNAALAIAGAEAKGES